MKSMVVGIALALTAQALVGQTAPHVRMGIVSDWTHRHVVYPDSKDESVMARARSDPRWVQSWYLRHPETWWPKRYRRPGTRIRRDWSVPLGSTAFEPVFDSSFTFSIPTETGFGTLNLVSEGGGTYFATAGSITVTGTLDVGTFPLYPATYPFPNGQYDISPNGAFYYDNLVYPSSNPTLDEDGLLFDNGGGLETNIWGNSPGNYSFYTSPGGGNYPIAITSDGSFTFDVASAADPGGGQTFPAKYVFDVTAAPSCANDFVAIGVPATPASGGQANIVGVNNLYSGGAGALCPTGPTVIFAYASGTGQVPAPVTLSRSGTQIAYVENLATGSSYFHVLTIGTTANEGSSATDAVVPGTGGSNALDQSVLLSPDGIINQSSTNAAFVFYTPNDASDVAYVTTYSMAGSGSGYLYKIGNVFNGSATPTIVWSVPIDAVPSTPVYDAVSNTVFFTDSSGRIDYVADSGTLPPVQYGPVVASGTTSENAVVVDSIGQMVYASFNSNGTNAIIVQAPIANMASFVSVPVGIGNTIYTSPYEPDFNNAFYTGSGTPLLYVAGTDTTTGTIPTLYSVGFNGSGVMNSSANTSAALATGIADSSPVSEFYNAAQGQDFLFVGVTNNCVATTFGGTAGCVMSLDITLGFPSVSAGTTALAAAGGSSGIIVDNDSSLTQASNIYYATKTGATLVKATQQGLD
jgi:hypothetical protein